MDMARIMGWLVRCAAGAAVVLCFTVNPETRAVAQAGQVELTVRAERRCPQCGWIESKRRVVQPGIDARALSYEYIIRMGDGSSRMFEEQLPASWRVGERLILID
jgi:hypothetical protein